MGNVDLEKLGLTQEEWDALSEEERNALLQGEPQKKGEGSPHQEPDEVEKKVKGILADLQKERAKNRELQEKVAQLQSEYEQVTSLLDELQEKKGEGDESVSDDDVATIKHVKNLLRQELDKYGGMFAQTISSLESKFLAISEKEAQAKYSPEKVGEELSYDKVIEEGLKPLLEQNPNYKLVIRNSPNPAEEAYRIGLTHPKFQEVLLKKKQQEILEKLSKEKAKTGVGSAGSGGVTGISESTPIEDLLRLSDEELDRLAREKG